MISWKFYIIFIIMILLLLVNHGFVVNTVALRLVFWNMSIPDVEETHMEWDMTSLEILISLVTYCIQHAAPNLNYSLFLLYDIRCNGESIIATPVFTFYCITLLYNLCARILDDVVVALYMEYWYFSSV